MKKKLARNMVVRLTPENTKRIAEYKEREPFSPNIQTIVNFAVQKFLSETAPDADPNKMEALPKYKNK